MSAPTRSVMRYMGGKWNLFPWLQQFFPPHTIYVEPFGGAASVLMRKAPSPIEVYNDLDDEVVELFRVLRDPASAERLRELCTLTPFARAEFEETYADRSTDEVENARRLLFRAAAAWGSSARARTKTGFRSKDGGQIHAAAQWVSWPEHIPEICNRLRGVIIEHASAERVIATHDSESTLFYLDPPYVHGTRSIKKRIADYQHEMGDDAHRALSVVLKRARGFVILSGYPCELYDRELYAEWFRAERQHMANGNRKRTEVVWLNDRAAAALQPTLFRSEA